MEEKRKREKEKREKRNKGGSEHLIFYQSRRDLRRGARRVSWVARSNQH